MLLNALEESASLGVINSKTADLYILNNLGVNLDWNAVPRIKIDLNT